jgi:hypothetical protein
MLSDLISGEMICCFDLFAFSVTSAISSEQSERARDGSVLESATLVQ